MTQRISKKEASVDAVLRSGNENEKGEQPIRIRVTYNRLTRYYPVRIDGKSIYIKPSEWEALHKVSPRGDRKKMKGATDSAKTAAINAIAKITSNGQQFTFERFESEFLLQESKKGFLKIFNDHLKGLLNEDRIGTYLAYQSAYTAFNKFRGAVYEFKGRKSIEIKQGKELSPIDITVDLLKSFALHLKNEKAGSNTIAMYMRSLKVVYNICIDHNPGLSEFYPFARKQNDKRKYKIKTGSGKKGEALSVDEIQALIKVKTTPGMPEHEAKLLWLFSFYCQGMNFRDMGLLKYSNIKGEVITYIRQKTKETEKEEIPMEIPLTDSIREIIVAIGTTGKRPSDYVFDFGLTNGMEAKERYNTIKQKTKVNNKWTKSLCRENDLPEITTYWARHSYANLLKQGGESVELIRELLGHSDIRTTEVYLNRFSIAKKKEANDRVMSILKAS